MYTIFKRVMGLCLVVMTSTAWAETRVMQTDARAQTGQAKPPEQQAHGPMPGVEREKTPICPPQPGVLPGRLDGAQSGEISDDALPMYVSSRAAVVVPANASEDSHALGAGFGLVSDDKSFFGLRVVWLPNPPSSSLSGDTPDVDTAWGPLLEWQNLFSPGKRLSFYSNLAAGFVYGTPSDPSTVDGEAADQNVILPLLELGVGMRVTSRSMGEYRAFIAPEFGYVPGADAPYAAVSVGLY